MKQRLSFLFPFVCAGSLLCLSGSISAQSVRLNEVYRRLDSWVRFQFTSQTFEQSRSDFRLNMMSGYFGDYTVAHTLDENSWFFNTSYQSSFVTERDSLRGAFEANGFGGSQGELLNWGNFYSIGESGTSFFKIQFTVTAPHNRPVRGDLYISLYANQSASGLAAARAALTGPVADTWSTSADGIMRHFHSPLSLPSGTYELELEAGISSSVMQHNFNWLEESASWSFSLVLEGTQVVIPVALQPFGIA